MRSIFISLLFGLIAAVIDVLPMIIRKMDRLFILSAFLFWVIAGFLISRIHLVPWGWLNGMIMAVLLCLPVLMLIIRVDRNALPIVIGSTLVLGAAVGAASGIFLRVS